MSATTSVKPATPHRRLRRRISRWVSRVDLYPRLEIALGLIAVAVGCASYFALTDTFFTAANTPSGRTILLVANLVPLMALLVLIGRRFVILRVNRRRGLAGARMHVRMVALFSAIAAIPTLLVVVFASLLFQFGTQFWFSDNARTVLQNAEQVAHSYVAENRQRIVADIEAMGTDVYEYANSYGVDSAGFADGLAFQVAARNLTEASVFTLNGEDYHIYASVGMTGTPLAQRILPTDIARARSGRASVLATASDRVEAIVRIDPLLERYVYVSRSVDPAVLQSAQRAEGAMNEYDALLARSKSLQWQFNLALFVIALLILAAAILSALWLANRLVAPIGRLVRAAEKVGAGDLAARVPVRNSPDEVGTLARTFNRMTRQLQAQTSALVSANEQLDARRQFTEAVLSSVSAGVISIDEDGHIRLVSHSAADLLEMSEDALGGMTIEEAVPEFSVLLEETRTSGQASGQVRIARGNDVQTLLVRMGGVSGGSQGYVITFDDITQQLADQRRAAWADVARRIAHEIKNPLTPIQLSAERLQRRYGNKIEEGGDTFRSLTETIVRQVGDLRQMVDEFSSFARMPKPVFRTESLLDIARQAIFLQEVAHSDFDYEMEIAPDLPAFICDRRQIAQALTNLLKNAAESVAARCKDGDVQGRIRLTARLGEPETLVVTVTDNGIGLPANQRDRLTEPYVTTRVKGTGLGLAIVKKIVEEHDGVLDLRDAEGGGASAVMSFDLAALQAHITQEPGIPEKVAVQQR
ncbi:sensor histidine kinase NtrY-like [Sphingosinicella microcystinivorans]|uniref:histidine kinase n=1 Tax=Sphingosinicella microcystinivorans TaxID=335406 RepID=A0ABX9T3V7_SPHMI|nr:PAS domain-containing sensor histidine kinase [Sphingosinicella microcystinivorans]RKS91997.1 two-component system nitrogen regulation sensor histidine kinase NtrY [Sphingosinicella microcystinivorans]